MTVATSAPAGWYPQPNGTLLYWDGRQWLMDSVRPSEGVPSPTATQAAANGFTFTWDVNELTIRAKGPARIVLHARELRLPYRDIRAFAHKGATKFGQGILLLGTEHGKLEIRYLPRRAEGFDELAVALAEAGVACDFEAVHTMKMYDPNRERLRAEREALGQEMREARQGMRTVSTRAAFAAAPPAVGSPAPSVLGESEHQVTTSRYPDPFASLPSSAAPTA